MLRLPVLLLLLLAAALAGCVAIAEESGRQLDEVGDVELETVVCASPGPASSPTCPGTGTGEVAPRGEYQLLMAYRLPAQTSAPESIGARELPLTLSRSSSLTAELERLAPPPPETGQRWTGYISPPFAYQALQAEDRATVVARVMLLRSDDGGPFAAPFRYRTIVGYRQAAPDPNRPVRCGETLPERNVEEETSCMTFPGEEDMRTDLSLQTRDLGIIAGPSSSVARGGSGSVPFTLAYNGGTASPAWALSATTTVPGGAASPATATAAPAVSGASVVPVTVSVPATTPPGAYEVTLTATHGSGQTRRAGGLLTVTGSGTVDRNPPELAMRMRTTPRLRRARRIGVVADASCSEPCTLTAQMRAGRISARRLGIRMPAGQRAVVVGSVAERRAAPGRRNVRIRFRRGLGPRMLRLRRLSLALSITARDTAGNARRRSLVFSLRR